MIEKLLTIKEVAEILSVTTKTLRNWDKDGKLKSIKTIGNHHRYKQTDINEFINRNK
jgi:putative resolvase